MSNKIINLKFVKNIVKIKKNSQFFRDSLIKYNEDQTGAELMESMKKGYKEMGEINLALSELSFEFEKESIDEYENWLCGV
ncbi:MAG: hypothetical protein IJO26_05175 [Clostridium sp.]|nr:hypothetical protein [Clostridium sp.]